MKAFVLEKYGTPMREVSMPEPTAGPRQVLVRMIAAGVNHADERTRAGELKAVFRLDLPQVMGGELSGEVVAVGDQVTEFAVGDEVYGYTGVVGMGTFGEVVAIDADAVALAPASADLVEAASLPVVALTAWQALVEIGHLQPGQRVLVHGGSGGVGSVAIQLAKHLGATVVTTASARNAEFVRGLGADEVIDYSTDDFVARLAGNPVDFVLDTQGGDTTTRSPKVVRPGGTVVGVAGTPDPHLADQAGAGRVVKLALAAVSLPLRRRARKLGVSYRFLFIHADGQALRTIAALVDRGVLRPVVDRVLPFEETPEALKQVLAGGTRGKVLVTTQPNPATTNSALIHIERPPTVPESYLSQRPMTWVTTRTRGLTVGGDSLAYRDLGPLGGTPVVLLTHLGATLDEWDPRVVDALAQQHRVVAVGALAGAGGSTGGLSIQGMADTVRALVAALGMGSTCSDSRWAGLSPNRWPSTRPSWFGASCSPAPAQPAARASTASPAPPTSTGTCCAPRSPAPTRRNSCSSPAPRPARRQPRTTWAASASASWTVTSRFACRPSVARFVRSRRGAANSRRTCRQSPHRR